MLEDVRLISMEDLYQAKTMHNSNPKTWNGRLEVHLVVCSGMLSERTFSVACCCYPFFSSAILLACNHPSWRIQINHAGGVGSIASDPVVMDCWRIQKHGAGGLVQKHQILLSWVAKNTPSPCKQRTMKLCYKFLRWHAFVELMMRTRVQQRRLLQLFFLKPLELQSAQKCLQSVENVWSGQCRYSLSKYMQQWPHLLG